MGLEYAQKLRLGIEAELADFVEQERPAMGELRTVIDQLETQVEAGLWPLPTYREMLVLK